MKFSGEIKFPEIDHPGVPVQFVIEGLQVELIVGGESLGRWSLYDVHARRLVASAFQIDLGGTEVTFVADDPIDFAYRGVEHMAETWASIKSKQLGRRAMAVRKSRKGAIPSRIGELREAMEVNLEAQSRPLAGEPVMPLRESEPDAAAEPVAVDWDARDPDAAIPVVGGPTEDSAQSPDEAIAVAAEVEARLAEEMRKLDEERQRIAEERARLEAERLEAEQREDLRIEAYRLEMQRLEVEREELRLQATLSAQAADEVVATHGGRAEEIPADASDIAEEPAETALGHVEELPLPEAEPAAEPEPVAAALEPVEIEDLPGPVEAEAGVAMEPEEPEPELAEPEPEPVEPEPELAEPEPELEPVEGGGSVLDLSDLEEELGAEPEDATSPAPQPQAAMAGTAPVRERGGLRGAVRAAFTRGGREHEHQFIEAPGGIGIIRYVCEICGYVSISVDD